MSLPVWSHVHLGGCLFPGGKTPPNHKSGRYASYWNAFLYCKLFSGNNYQSLTRLRATCLHFFFNCSMSRLCLTSSSCFWNYIPAWNNYSYDDWYFSFFIHSRYHISFTLKPLVTTVEASFLGPVNNHFVGSLILSFWLHLSLKTSGCPIQLIVHASIHSKHQVAVSTGTVSPLAPSFPLWAT